MKSRRSEGDDAALAHDSAARPALIAAMLALTLLTSACTQLVADRTQSQAMTRALSRGYAPQEQTETLTREEAWTLGEESLQVSLTLPVPKITGAGAAAPGAAPPGAASHNAAPPRPLVIYLPGLGEAASAGRLWREAWAGAGYVVLSVQPAKIAQALDRPPSAASVAAQADDVQSMAHATFGLESIVRRRALLGSVLAEARRRATHLEQPWADIDFTRIVLAGFELGAQTSLAAAGERIDDQPTPALPGLRGVIALSPHVDIARGSVRQRFAAIGVPVLAITGTEDSDPFGIINAASVRRAVWLGMPAGDKYLLITNGGNHALIAGNGLRNPPPPPWLKLERRMDGTLVDDASGRGQGRRGGMGPSMIGTGRIAAGDNADLIANRPFDGRHLAAILSVSRAFLDLTLREDGIAREWLTRDARRWLGDAAQLEAK